MCLEHRENMNKPAVEASQSLAKLSAKESPSLPEGFD
jgi:hypothetical protein